MADLHFDKARTEWVTRDGPVRCIRLRGAFMGAATYVTETPGGLFINGDCPVGGRRGCGTFDAKTLAWLRGVRGSCLHQRFLRETWSAERFVAGLKDAAEDAEDYGYSLSALQEAMKPHVDWQERGEMRAFEAWTDEIGGESEDSPGYGLDAKDCRLLDEIAACVAELFARDEVSRA